MNSLIESVPVEIVEDLKIKWFQPSEIPLSFHFVSGGCINHGGKLTTNKREIFLKWNDKNTFPGMFEAEQKGMVLLKESKGPYVPEVFGTSEAGNKAYIIMDFVNLDKRVNNYYELLGEELAQLHRNTQTSFGLHYPNYIGSLPQENTETTDWVEFFMERRIDFQVELLRNRGLYDSFQHKKWEQLKSRLSDIFPEEKPSLLHGDLWSGNLIVGPQGKPCLIDPAIYYGHREMELAFTTLFGGFDSAFYQSYQATFPMEPGYRDRFDIYNLYPLLVHANLFGGSYLKQANRVMREW